MLWIGIMLIILAIIAIYLAVPGGRLWKQYLADVKVSLRTNDNWQCVFTEDTMAGLPDLLRKHIINGGYLNQPCMDTMLIRFHHAKFRMSEEKKPIRIQFMQINCAGKPDRHAFLSGRMAGLPIQAKDSVLDGYGSMTGVLAKLIPLFHSTGPEMDQGQLITALADAVYMPSLFLQPFVSWNSCDDHTVEGTITWKNVCAKGKFTFDDNGTIIQFDTNDRYRDENGKGGYLVPWRVRYFDYQKQNGFFQPGSVAVSWMLSDGEETYFASDQIEVRYSIGEKDLP